MGKKADESSSIPAKEHASCAWSFINIFEFGESFSPRKFLAHKKLGSGRDPGSSHLRNNDLEYACEGKHGHDAIDVEVCGATTAHSYLPSVRTLIEEEMSKERISKPFEYCLKIDQMVFNNNKNAPNSLINNLMDSAEEILKQFACKEPAECSNFILDLSALMVEFYSVSRHCPDIYAERSSSYKKNVRVDDSGSLLAEQSMLQDALVVEAEVFLRKKIEDSKRLVGNGVMQSQGFMDVLEILNSNKVLFLKLMQDPHSLVFKHIQDCLKNRIAEFSNLESVHCSEESACFEDKVGDDSCKNVKPSSNKVLQKQKLQIFSKKKGKCKREIASKDENILEEMNRIVVLKPRLSRNHGGSTSDCPRASNQSNYTHKLEKYSEKFVSHFSFKEIKRKLRLIIGESRRKEQHLMSRDDDLLNRVPFGYKASSADTKMITCTENNRKKVPSKTDCRQENTSQSSPSVNETDKKSLKKKWQINIEAEIALAKTKNISLFSPIQGDFFGEEGDKHFTEKLCTDYRTVNSTNKTTMTLERTLSLSDDTNSPKLSHVQTISSPKLQLFCDTPTLEGTTGSRGDLDVQIPVIEFVEEDDKVEPHDETSNEEHINPAEPQNTLNIATAGTENSFSSEICEEEEEECLMPFEQSTPNEKPRILIPPASVSPCSLTINDFAYSKLIIEKPERPSPVSVLEPFFVEDDASPDRSNIECAELHIPSQHFNDNEDFAIVINASDCSIPHQRSCSYDVEAMINHVRTVLETYNFDSGMNPDRLPSSELSLQSLDELKALSSCPGDPKLIFDCVNEAMVEMNDRRFHIYSVRPITIVKDVMIHEVCKTIESYLKSQLQSTLDDIMRKDMGSAMWMNLGLQVECIVAEISCSIFEDLMEEAMIELFL